jgi:hypothetical protein
MDLLIIIWEEMCFSAKTSLQSRAYERNFVYKDICRKIFTFVSVTPVTLKMSLNVVRFRKEVEKCEISILNF